MECEMCGKTVGTQRYLVEGTVMRLGIECSKYGSPLDQPASAGSQAAVNGWMTPPLPRWRKIRSTTRNAPQIATA